MAQIRLRPPGGPWRVVFYGQSMNNLPTGFAYPDHLMSGRGIPWKSVAVDASPWAALDGADAVALLHPQANHQDQTILILNGGQTDLDLGGSGQSVYDTVVGIADAARVAGFDYVIATTVTPVESFSGADETQRLAHNALLVANADSKFDAVVDLAADPRLDDYTDTTYYEDDPPLRIHWSSAGAAVAAELIAPVLDSILTAPPAFDPWDTGTYPTPLHGVWLGDPAWTEPADGGAIASLRNVSGGGDPAQATGGSQPTYRASTAAFNNRPTAEADGGDSLNFNVTNIAQPVKYVVVCSISAADTRAIGFSLDASEGIGRAVSGNWVSVSASGHILSGGAADSNPHVIQVDMIGNAGTIYVDGVQVGTQGTFTGGVELFTLFAAAGGSNRRMTGHIAFAAMYGNDDLSTLVADLMTHYGL